MKQDHFEKEETEKGLFWKGQHMKKDNSEKKGNSEK